ncbi:YheC/YheD family protein [Cohnella silvisoli]|uniref:YheC/YheD family protein n=1 Tax=Cohnella silvisoli TaxID=2873699 RepID=A0ABV1L1U6_9BACL|nr:YheC/YheD family protein [Cohnella silvisoli]MCD9026463.1 YheC/YheD family protein [Cohnella silvisoli]
MASSSGRRRPIVGVIVGRRLVRTEGMRELAEANQVANTTLHFFSARNVDFRRRKISGIRFNSRKRRWERSSIRRPDVLYVRGGSSAIVRRTVDRFDRMGIPRINPLVRFSKSELFQKLKQDENIRPYLPYTKSIHRFSNVRKYVRKLGTVYIKANYGRKGTQVMRAIKIPEGGYGYSYAVIHHLVRNKVDHFKDLKKVMKSFFGNREFIVQEAIDLIRVGQDQPVDFRAELQRDGKGKLNISGISVRVGQSHSPITTHASAYKMDDQLQDLFPEYSKDEIEDLNKKIRDFVITVYKGVERCYGKFGELGIDFAVDSKGKIWLIECNAQSAKVSIGKAYGPKTRRQIYLIPLQYAKRLANKNRKRKN